MYPAFVINDFEGERVIERITVMGDEVAAAGGLHAYEPYVRRGHYRQRVGTIDNFISTCSLRSNQRLFANFAAVRHQLHEGAQPAVSLRAYL